VQAARRPLATAMAMAMAWTLLDLAVAPQWRTRGVASRHG
jgi:hypothetical protein